MDNYRQMIGEIETQTRFYVVKRISLRDIYITKQERDIICKAMEANLKIVQVGLFTIILSSITAIEPREEIK